jgi:hypothetical protein
MFKEVSESVYLLSEVKSKRWKVFPIPLAINKTPIVRTKFF